MKPNGTGVVTSMRSMALDYLAAADAAKDALRDGPHDRFQLAALHQSLGHALKSADVCAALSISDELRLLRFVAAPAVDRVVPVQRVTV